MADIIAFTCWVSGETRADAVEIFAETPMKAAKQLIEYYESGQLTYPPCKGPRKVFVIAEEILSYFAGIEEELRPCA